MNTKKIIVTVTSVVLALTVALGLGALSFDKTDKTSNVKAELVTIKTVDANKILKSENIITKLGTSPIEKAAAKTFANKKKRAKLEAKKKAKLKKAKKNAAKKATDKSNDGNFKYLGSFNATAYCGCAACCGSAGGHTASGTVPTAGRTIATDPSVIPLGSKVKIDGHVYTAEDTGGAIGGKRVDIFFSSHSAALQFGRRSVEVYIQK